MEDSLRVNAKQIGLDATVDSLRELLVEQFQLAVEPGAIDSRDPLFSTGVGLSSLEGLELLGVLEKKYGVQFQDLDFWVEESPSLDCVARYLVDNSPVNSTSP